MHEKHSVESKDGDFPSTFSVCVADVVLFCNLFFVHAICNTMSTQNLDKYKPIGHTLTTNKQNETSNDVITKSTLMKISFSYLLLIHESTES